MKTEQKRQKRFLVCILSAAAMACAGVGQSIRNSKNLNKEHTAADTEKSEQFRTALVGMFKSMGYEELKRNKSDETGKWQIDTGFLEFTDGEDKSKGSV